MRENFLGAGRFRLNQVHCANISGWLFEMQQGDVELLRISEDLIGAAAERLRVAAALDKFSIDYGGLDPSNTSLYCSTAWERDEIEALCLSSYYASFMQFLLIYTVVESFKASSDLGKAITKCRALKILKFDKLDYYPGLKKCIDDVGFFLVERRRHCFKYQSEPIEQLLPSYQSLIGSHFELGNELVRKYRHYLAHGKEAAPQPDDDYDFFRLPDGNYLTPPAISRAQRMASLALTLLHVYFINSLDLPSSYIPVFQHIDGDLLPDQEFSPAETLLRCNPLFAAGASNDHYLL